MNLFAPVVQRPVLTTHLWSFREMQVQTGAKIIQVKRFYHLSESENVLFWVIGRTGTHHDGI